MKNRNLLHLSMSAGSEQGTTDSNGEMTPPLTPFELRRSTESKDKHNIWRRDFHTYLRAFYPYHPTGDENSTTVNLPLEFGDVILIHSVHTNGWADGTLLTTGARGWLPTNYCEPYASEPMRILLKALTNFWDLVRGTTRERLKGFRSQDYVRGLGAGVRYLLVCTRDIYTHIPTSVRRRDEIPVVPLSSHRHAYWVPVLYNHRGRNPIVVDGVLYCTL